jgi:creatinine amidohydrolase
MNSMTNWFHYEELTWPEVAALPRNIPFVLPFGTGYPLERFSEALGNPNCIGLLPAFPFGWEGSGLHLPEPVLVAYVRNLLDSLRDDGFSQVYLLIPQGLEWSSQGFSDVISLRISLPLPPQPVSILPPDSERGKVILFPIGHTEQHGYHLPLSTDTIIIDAIARGTSRTVPELAYALPVMPYGVSTHRPSFAGTLNAGGRAFEDFWLATIDALAARGFDRFYLLSGHGGNCSFLVNVVKYAGERHRRIFCATTWLYLNSPQGIETIQEHRCSSTGGMGHACELETSFLLHLQPNLVHMERVVDETDFISTPSYTMDWVEGGALIANPPWDDDTRTGAYGAGSLASAEHGRLWLEAAIAEKASQVSEIHEQHKRREERRKAGFGLWGKH